MHDYGQIELPLFGTPSTHIIKPSAADYPDAVYNECFAMRLADRVGLAAAKCGLMRIGGSVYYWTERYDRETVDGRIRRLHQEDFCQMLAALASEMAETWPSEVYGKILDVIARQRLAVVGEVVAEA